MKRNISCSGQSLIEFALLIPVVILSFTAFIDLGRAMFLYSALANAAREGTRHAIVNQAETEADRAAIASVVKSYSASLNPDDVDVTVVLPGTDGYITVTARYFYNPITPGLNAILGGGNIELKTRSSALMAPLYR